jgi:CBS domain-containing protein
MSTTDKGNAARFITAFKRIEQTLREVLEDTDPDTKYKTLIGEAAKVGYGPVNTYQQRLHTFGYLRNAILHSPDSSDEEVIAEPRTDIVEEIEDIAENLGSPPTVDTVYVDSVYSVYGNQPVSEVAFEMKERDFSQAPVTNYDKEFQTLLTTNSIARWFAETAHQDADLSKATVEEVLSHREKEEHYAVLSPDDTLFDLLDLFDADTNVHIPPYAAVVTKDGTDSGTLEGIITPFDLPEAYGQLAPSHR